MIQPLWRTVWSFLKKLQIELPYDPAIPLLGIYPEKTIIQRVMSGFPGGAVVESPPADAGDTGSCPRPGRSHMPRSGWAHEPWPLGLCVRSLCSATGEVTAVTGPRTANKQTNKKNKTYL